MDTIKRELKKKMSKLLNDLVDVRSAPIDDQDFDKAAWADEARDQLLKIYNAGVVAFDEVYRERLAELDNLVSPGQQTLAGEGK